MASVRTTDKPTAADVLTGNSGGREGVVLPPNFQGQVIYVQDATINLTAPESHEPVVLVPEGPEDEEETPSLDDRIGQYWNGSAWVSASIHNNQAYEYDPVDNRLGNVLSTVRGWGWLFVTRDGEEDLLLPISTPEPGDRGLYFDLRGRRVAVSDLEHHIDDLETINFIFEEDGRDGAEVPGAIAEVTNLHVPPGSKVSIEPDAPASPLDNGPIGDAARTEASTTPDSDRSGPKGDEKPNPDAVSGG